jgi:NADH-quinone oxidoreductase subunit J
VSLSFIFFGVLAVLAIASAVNTIMSKNPVASALSLVFHFFMLSGLYLTLNAQFVAVIQILVYAGAIMVLVIFVIMLLNLGDEEKRKKISFSKGLAFVLGMALFIQILAVVLAMPMGQNELAAASIEQSTVQNIGRVLYTEYVFAVEMIGILLLVAIIGAVMLAKRKLSN